MNRRLVKLVRDRIAAFIGGDVSIEYKSLSRDDHVRMLRRKLIEEAIEYLEEPCLDELGDVLEVVETLARVDLGLDVRQVTATAAAKREERGGFDGGIGMWAVLPDDHVQTDRQPVDLWEAM